MENGGRKKEPFRKEKMTLKTSKLFAEREANSSSRRLVAF
jgi:hypothetical protein